MWEEYNKNRELRREIDGNVDKYIAELNACYFNDGILAANPVMSRDLTENPLVEKLIAASLMEEKSSEFKFKFKFLFFFKKVIFYYAKSFMLLLLFAANNIVHKASRLKFEFEGRNRSCELVVIDILMMAGKNFPGNKFYDPFFGGLYATLKKNKIKHVVLTVLYGTRAFDFKKRYDSYNMLADDAADFVTEYDLLVLSDYLRLLRFILVYPFATLQLLNIKINSLYDNILKDSVIENLDGGSFFRYVYYLIGRRFDRLTNKRIKLFSWYENKLRDKLLYKGVRDSSAKSYIYGCQFFISWLDSMRPGDEEGLYKKSIPDETLVSGSGYLKKGTSINYKLGVSPRYNYLFKIDYDPDELQSRDKIIILLTIHIEDSKNIINAVRNSNIGKKANKKIYIKFHPNHLVEDAGYVFPDEWVFTTEDLGDLCKEGMVVISSGSGGSILEAAIMGCSVITIGNKHGLTFNSMPDFGKGEIWDEAFDSKELDDVYKTLMEFREGNIEGVIELAKKCRELCFTEATEDRFVEIFDLKNKHSN